MAVRGLDSGVMPVGIADIDDLWLARRCKQTFFDRVSQYASV